MLKAANLDEALLFFNHQAQLNDAQLQAWFVERPDSPRLKMRRWLAANTTPQKLLFIGHRGCGKSTELRKLMSEIGDDMLSIGIDALEINGRTDLSYEDVMFTLFTRTLKEIFDRDLAPRSLRDRFDRVWQPLREWWQRMISGIPLPATSEMEWSTAFKTQVAEAELSFRQSLETREQIRNQISLRIPELIRYLNEIVSEAEQETNKRLLLILEGLDKIDLAAARSLFRDHAATLVSPKVNIIFTCPSALRYSEDLEQIRQQFSHVFILPNITTHYPKPPIDPANPSAVLKRRPHGEGFRALRAMVLNRLHEELIEPRAFNRLISASGGVPTILIRMVQNAALAATGSRIALTEVNAAIVNERQFIVPTLTKSDWEVLQLRASDRRLTADEENRTLLYKGALVEYQADDGTAWCDVHPVLWDLLPQTYDSDQGSEQSGRMETPSRKDAV